MKLLLMLLTCLCCFLPLPRVQAAMISQKHEISMG